MKHPTRRRVLRGLLGGAAVTVGVPLLDVFLDPNGVALAQDGTPLPLRFGTWFWGCGMNPDRWIPQRDGADYDLPPELTPLEAVRGHVSILSGFDVILDGTPNTPHVSGVVGHLTGTAPAEEFDVPAPTYDTLVAETLSGATRFRSLELSAAGTTESYSLVAPGVVNPSEISPQALYDRLFGPDFHDPADADFVPDPRLALRQSVLSAVTEDRLRLERRLGAHDRRRLDQYFTSLRQLERQLEVLQSGPPDLAACARPSRPRTEQLGAEVGRVRQNHDLMAGLLAMALACDQVRTFNMVFSPGLSPLRQAGANVAHHQLTHDEPLDAELGYQPRATEFVLESMTAWASLVSTLNAIPEGDGTLLDRCLVVGHSETSFAKIHDVTRLPVMFAGRAGGRIRPGLHVRGRGEPVTRLALTAQQVMGRSIERFGTGSMEVDRGVSEVLA